MLLHKLGYYAVERFLCVDGIAMGGRGGVKHLLEESERAKCRPVSMRARGVVRRSQYGAMDALEEVAKKATEDIRFSQKRQKEWTHPCMSSTGSVRGCALLASRG